MNAENPYRSPEADDARPAGDHGPYRSQRIADRMGMASLICALVFPITFYGIHSLETHGVALSWPAAGRLLVACVITTAALFAVVLGFFSLAKGIRSTALIGVTVGAVELFLCLAFAA